MKNNRKIKGLYLTEAGHLVGLGHLKRAQALTELLCDFDIDIKLEEAMSDPTFGHFLRWSTKKGISEISQNYDVLFFDSFYGQPQLYDELERFPCVIYIDDFIRYPVKTGMIVDWTVGAETRLRTADEHCFGLNYLVTRKDFCLRKRRNLNISKIENITVVFGGADPYNLTMQTHRLLEGLGIKKINYLGTNLYPGYQLMHDEPRFFWDLPEKKFVDKLASSDLVITAGGQTLYELASLGTPSVSISIEKNQDDDVNGFEEIGTTIKLNDINLLPDLISSITPDKLIQMNRATHNISGNGKALKNKIYRYVQQRIL